MPRFEYKLQCKAKTDTSSDVKLVLLIEHNHKLRCRIDLKALVKNGQIIARLGERKNIKSEISAMKLNGEYIILVYLFITWHFLCGMKLLLLLETFLFILQHQILDVGSFRYLHYGY